MKIGIECKNHNQQNHGDLKQEITKFAHAYFKGGFRRAEADCLQFGQNLYGCLLLRQWQLQSRLTIVPKKKGIIGLNPLIWLDTAVVFSTGMLSPVSAASSTKKWFVSRR